MKTQMQHTDEISCDREQGAKTHSSNHTYCLWCLNQVGFVTQQLKLETQAYFY